MDLVMRGHFRSRDKDGGHTIQSTIVKNPDIQANFVALSFIEPINVLHYRNKNL